MLFLQDYCPSNRLHHSTLRSGSADGSGSTGSGSFGAISLLPFKPDYREETSGPWHTAAGFSMPASREMSGSMPRVCFIAPGAARRVLQAVEQAYGTASALRSTTQLAFDTGDEFIEMERLAEEIVRAEL